MKQTSQLWDESQHLQTFILSKTVKKKNSKKTIFYEENEWDFELLGSIHVPSFVFHLLFEETVWNLTETQSDSKFHFLTWSSSFDLVPRFINIKICRLISRPQSSVITKSDMSLFLRKHNTWQFKTKNYITHRDAHSSNTSWCIFKDVHTHTYSCRPCTGSHQKCK